jgi:hypothetical protein
MAFRIHEGVMRGEVFNRLEKVMPGELPMKSPAKPALLNPGRKAQPELPIWRSMSSP